MRCYRETAENGQKHFQKIGKELKNMQVGTLDRKSSIFKLIFIVDGEKTI